MFGWKRQESSAAVQWPPLLALLEDDDRRAALEQIAPIDGRQSFIAAAKRIDTQLGESVLGAGRQLHSAAMLVQRPTVAIAGMLNSGKTSLVASFLSPFGRARTLRGFSDDSGTHRFVLWLPAAWKKDPELWGLLVSRLGDSLGSPPEMLADAPEEAHQQYNNRGGDGDHLSVPLIAVDPALDEAGIGLLDCPDIVSDESFGLGSPEARRKLLGQAATLCSAFIVVTAAESSRDATLGDLLRIAGDLMPGVPRMLAVNKVRPQQTPDQVAEAFRPLVDRHGIDSVYAAYDFDIPASGPFIPTIDSGAIAGTDSDGDSLPVFYSIDRDPDQNPPAHLPPERLLSALPGQLDHGALFDKFRLALEAGLRTAVWDVGLQRIEEDAAESINMCQQARICLLNVALDYFAHRDVAGEVIELRLHQSERIVRQLGEAFVATAPWYARWGVRLNTGVRRFFGGAGDLVRQLTPTGIAQRAADDVKGKFVSGQYGGLFSPGRLRKSIERHGGNTALCHWDSEAAWDEATETAILRFERDDFTSLDPRRLDEAVQQMWNEIPVRKKMANGLTPLLAVLASFGAVLTIPIDFGASFIASASVAELLAAAGMAGMATMWAGKKSTQDVGQQAARQQLADFHAVLCDTFGVPRGIQPDTIQVGKLDVTLPVSNITKRDACGPQLAMYRVRDDFRQELARQLPR